MSTTIQVIKLINGDEIIGKMLSSIDGIVVEQPRLIAMMQTGPNTMGVALVPWLASNVDGKVTLKYQSIMTDMFDASNELEKQYLQQVSGIAIASALATPRK